MSSAEIHEGSSGRACAEEPVGNWEIESEREGEITEFELTTCQHLDAGRSAVFDFFSRAENLETITPPFLRFEIVSPTPIEMDVGVTIDYRLRLHGLPFRWSTEISVWEPEHRFVDRQIRGPYRKWVHEHRFEEVEGGTRCTDTVRFAVLGGRPVVALLVRADLRKIFEYRCRVLAERFGSPSSGPLVVEIGRYTPGE